MLLGDMKNNKQKGDNTPATPSKWYEDYVRFVELKGLATRTRYNYLSWVRRVARHAAPRLPEKLSETEVLDFLIALRVKHGLKDSTINQAVCALRCFYRDHLGRDWEAWSKIKIRREQQLPNVLSQRQVGNLLAAVRENRFRAVFTMMYHCGLRLSEAVNLKPGHIDGERRVVRVVAGKGGKSREVPITDELLVRLRRFWAAHHNSEWLFPGVGQGWSASTLTRAKAMGACKKPMSNASVQNAMRMTVASLGWTRGGGKRPVTCHTLRHCYATHLLEAGVSIRLVSQYLGHASLIPTMVYLHLTEVSESMAREVLKDFPGI